MTEKALKHFNDKFYELVLTKLTAITGEDLIGCKDVNHIKSVMEQHNIEIVKEDGDFVFYENGEKIVALRQSYSAECDDGQYKSICRVEYV